MCNRTTILPSPLKAYGLLCVSRTVAHSGGGSFLIGATMTQFIPVKFDHLDIEVLQKKLLSKTVSDTSNPESCWIWSGAFNKMGYGVVYHKGRMHMAHRIALHIQDTSAQMECACHKCDNPSCVNPSHLFWGTHKDNSNDKQKKGRQYRPSKVITHCKNGHEFTEENTRRNLNEKGQIRRHCKICVRLSWLRNNKPNLK